MFWWPWSSSRPISPRAFTSTATRRTSEQGTRSHYTLLTLLSLTCRENGAITLSCLDRVWCLVTPLTRLKSPCLSPSSSPTNSTPRWPSCDATAPCPGSGPTQRHRYRRGMARPLLDEQVWLVRDGLGLNGRCFQPHFISEKVNGSDWPGYFSSECLERAFRKEFLLSFSLKIILYLVYSSLQ